MIWYFVGNKLTNPLSVFLVKKCLFDFATGQFPFLIIEKMWSAVLTQMCLFSPVIPQFAMIASLHNKFA